MTCSATLPLALTMGDPAGCGPAITAKAWHALKDEAGAGFYVIGTPELYADLAPIELIAHPENAATHFASALPVLPVAGALAVAPGKPDPAAAPAIINAITQAVEHVQAGLAGAIVTNPINKALLYDAGFAHPGHTEFLAHLCKAGHRNAPQPVMLLVGGGLRVALATIHLPLMEVGGALSTNHLQRVAQIVHADLVTRFGIACPRLVFTGLNPHAGESGALGREEIDIINPAAQALRDAGIDISDALPADTVFAAALNGEYDAVIAMTHDQGLIPVKTLDLWGGVNVTLGLPFIRTSPDHGTAYDAAAAGNVRADSLIAAIRLAQTMAAR